MRDHSQQAARMDRWSHSLPYPARSLSRDGAPKQNRPVQPGDKTAGATVEQRTSESFEARVEAAKRRRQGRGQQASRYLGWTCATGQVTLSRVEGNRAILSVKGDAGVLRKLGFVERNPPTASRPGTYEARDPAMVALAEEIVRRPGLPVPVFMPCDPVFSKEAVLMMHPLSITAFAEATDLNGFVAAGGALGLDRAALGTRLLCLAPWLHPALTRLSPYPQEWMEEARREPLMPPFLRYLPARRAFLFLDDGRAQFSAELAGAGFVRVPHAPGAWTTTSPAAARTMACFADDALAGVLDDMARRWPFAFRHLTCDDLPASLNTGIEERTGRKRSGSGPKVDAARAVDYDPAQRLFTVANAAEALELGVPDLDPATLGTQAGPARPAALWGFKDTASALRWRMQLTDEAECELLCRLVTGSVAAAADPSLHPPEPAPGIAYDHFQLDGIRHAMRGPTTSIADDMGTGKTFQGTAVADLIRSAKDGSASVLVVAPADQLDNWTRKLTSVPAVPFAIVRLDPQAATRRLGLGDLVRHVPKSTPDPRCREDGRGEAVVVSFETIVANPRLPSLGWDLVLIDEAHNLKTPGSLRNLAMLGKPGERPVVRAGRMVWMTGTDITDTPTDYYPFISTAVWRSGHAPTPLDRFVRMFNPQRGQQGDDGPSQSAGTRRLARLADALDRGPRIRRLKEDVYDGTLLPKSARPWLVPMADASVLAHVRDEAAKCDDLEAARGFAQRTAALKTLGSSRLTTALAKVPHMVEAIRRVARPDDPILVFAHHTKAADALHAALVARGIDAGVAHGKNTNPSERAQAAEAFNAGTWTVLVTTIMGLNAGHTITRTRHVWFLELDHKARLIEQCEDRAWRRGQQRNVRIRYFHIAGSYDGRVAASILRKAQVADVASGDDRRRMRRVDAATGARAVR